MPKTLSSIDQSDFFSKSYFLAVRSETSGRCSFYFPETNRYRRIILNLTWHPFFRIEDRFLETTAAASPLATASNSAPKSAPAVKVTPPSSNNQNGSTFFQRFSSFLTGCGVGFGASAYFIYNELEDSNRAFERDIQTLKAQIAALQK